MLRGLRRGMRRKMRRMRLRRLRRLRMRMRQMRRGRMQRMRLRRMRLRRLRCMRRKRISSAQSLATPGAAKRREAETGLDVHRQSMQGDAPTTINAGSATCGAGRCRRVSMDTFDKEMSDGRL